jgi:7-cyano-7-deazaguanine synthase
MPQSILILSGGLDSTVSAWIAKEQSQPVLALTFDYGQRAARKEQEAAGKTAKALGVVHRVLSLPWLRELTGTALVSSDKPLPSLKEEDLENLAKGRKSAAAVWVPNRNGLFLSIAACYAESLDAKILVTGFNAEEGITFPDNSAPFVRAADEFFWYATQKKVRVVSHTLAWNKAQIVRKAAELKIPFQDLWFCYEGGKAPCRRCESCLRAFRAFREAGIRDPWSSPHAD